MVSLATGLETVSEAQAIGDAALVMKRFGVGTEGRNDGLVVLFDLDTTLRHGQIRIYPGYDLEAAGLPPDVAEAIFENEMGPLAAAGNLDDALLGGLAAIDATLRDAAGIGTGAGVGPAGAWTPGPDEPMVEDPGVELEPGTGFGGSPVPGPGDGFGGFAIVVLLGIAGIILSGLAGAFDGGSGGGWGAVSRSWGMRSHRNDHDTRMGGGGDVGGDGGSGFGGGGDSGGSGGGGGGF